MGCVYDKLGLFTTILSCVDTLSIAFELFKRADSDALDPDLEESFMILCEQREKLHDLWVDLASETALNEGCPF